MSADEMCRCGHADEDHTNLGCGMVLTCRCKVFVLITAGRSSTEGAGAVSDDDRIDEKPRRCWADEAKMRCYLGMKRRITLAELISHFEENYPHVDPMAVNLNYSTATWEEPPTQDDLAKREANRKWQAERQERWERTTYAKLKAKFEPGPVGVLRAEEKQP